MPIGVRMPVDSMSMRALIGIVHALEMPGNCSALSSSAISLSVVMPGRHSDSGFRLITVSNISIGAGSVAVLARPALPYTELTSGKLLMILSCVCSTSAALVIDMPGSDVGMYSSVPSFSVGMNSVPRRDAGTADTASTATASAMVASFQRITAAMIGR